VLREDRLAIGITSMASSAGDSCDLVVFGDAEVQRGPDQLLDLFQRRTRHDSPRIEPRQAALKLFEGRRSP